MGLSKLYWLFITSMVLMLSGCGTPTPYDYTAFKKHHPKSILILPPINATTDIKATPAVYAHATLPLAESGYYVLPVSLVNETFKQNGLTSPDEIHSLPIAKLQEIFKADAALYMKVSEYGSSYKVISSDVTVALEGKLIDLKTGELLWSGTARASSAEQQNNGNSLVGMLIVAIVNQIVNTTTDKGVVYANIADQRLLSAGGNGRILFGHRSPRFGQDGQ